MGSFAGFTVIADSTVPPDTAVLMRDGVEVGRITNIELEEHVQLANYQHRALETAIYPEIDGSMLIYPAIGLADEAGEVLGKIKKLYRDDAGVLYQARREAILLELGDVAWYIAVMLHHLGHPLTIVSKLGMRAQEYNSLGEAALSLGAATGRACSWVHHMVYSQAIRNERDMATDRKVARDTLATCWHVLEAVAHGAGYIMDEVMEANIHKLQSRAERAVIGGDGDVR